jgi:hypothetical protein
MPTTQEMLDAVNAAIKSILDKGGNKSYTIGSRTFQSHELTQLMALRDQLRKEIAGANDNTTFAKFDNPS